MELLDLLGLSFRQHFGQHLVDAHLPGNRFGGLAVVAGDHGNLQAHPVDFGNGVLRTVLERIRHGDHAPHRAIHRHQHGRLGLGLELLHFGFQPIQRIIAGGHHAQVADRHGVAIHFGFHARPGFGFEAAAFRQRQAARGGFGPDGLAQRVLGAFFHRSRQPQ